jgi:hypothetical protein
MNNKQWLAVRHFDNKAKKLIIARNNFSIEISNQTITDEYTEGFWKWMDYLFSSTVMQLGLPGKLC